MISQLNYKHLRYFLAVAQQESIARAAERLHVSPQTISGQLTMFEDAIGKTLFDRKGRRLVLNEQGKLVQRYAEDIFALGDELQQALRSNNNGLRPEFRVGVTETIPKAMASEILRHCLRTDGTTKLTCREGDFDALLGELAVDRLDMVIADRPLAPGVSLRAFNHRLGESGLSFFAKQDPTGALRDDFPKSLQGQPFLMCGDKSSQKLSLQSWFENEKISPKIVAEFDDSAMMKNLGKLGAGIFCAPTIIENYVARQYDTCVIGRTNAVREQYYAISPERMVKNAMVNVVIEKARTMFEPE